jgi:hypothetical protein
MPTPKRCTTCGEDYPPTAEFWTRRGDDRTKWRAQCKQCFNAYRKERKRNRRAEQSRTQRSRGLKVKFDPCVRVVEDMNGNRRALMYWEDVPRDGETMIGVGSDLLALDEQNNP